jgi:hypothetical protein
MGYKPNHGLQSVDKSMTVLPDAAKAAKEATGGAQDDDKD